MILMIIVFILGVVVGYKECLRHNEYLLKPIDDRVKALNNIVIVGSILLICLTLYFGGIV